MSKRLYKRSSEAFMCNIYMSNYSVLMKQKMFSFVQRRSHHHTTLKVIRALYEFIHTWARRKSISIVLTEPMVHVNELALMMMIVL